MDKNKIKIVFAERLKDLMDDKGLNQSTLAEKINIPQQTINGWLIMNRLVQIDSLYILADFFGVTIDYLVGRED